MNNQCPPDRDETAERFVMGKLPEADAKGFREHFSACPDCQAAVKRAEDFVRAMKDAGRELRDREKN